MTGLVTWTDADTQTLSSLWATGASAAQIAPQLGRSRCSVIGKLLRMNLLGSTAAKPTNKTRIQSKPYVTYSRTKKPRPSRAKAKPLPLAMPAESIPPTQRKSLIELTNETCRFPYGEPCAADFFFCGADEADLVHGMPYCRFHMNLCCRASATA